MSLEKTPNSYALQFRQISENSDSLASSTIAGVGRSIVYAVERSRDYGGKPCLWNASLIYLLVVKFDEYAQGLIHGYNPTRWTSSCAMSHMVRV